MGPLKLNKLFDESQIAKRIREMGEEITRALVPPPGSKQQEEIVAVCVLKGSFIFYSDLVRHIEADVRTDFLGCASYGNAMKSSGEVKLTLDLTHGIEGKTVLLVEDIVDTGLTMTFLTKTLMARNPKRLLCATFLFKPDALKVDFKPDFVGFKISKEFVVGYGLDYQGNYRNLPYIAQVGSLQ